jgi:hypothetical protein
LVKEVGGESGDPGDEVETGLGLEDEHSNGLLEDESDDDRVPLDKLLVARAQEVEDVEDEEAEDRDCPLAVGRSGGQGETVGTTKDETEEREPSDGIPGVFVQLEEGSLDAGDPGLSDRLAEDGGGNESEEDAADEEPGEDSAVQKGRNLSILET